MQTSSADASGRSAPIDGQAIDKLGEMYAVHRATAARWIVGARAHVLSHIEQRIREDLRLSPSEVKSVLRAVKSRLDVSVARLLGSLREAEGLARTAGTD